MTEINNEKKYGIQDLIDAAKDMEGYAIAAYTDKYVIDIWNPGMDINKDTLLDIRVFSKDQEVRLFRSALGRDFHFLVQKDDKNSDIHDEVQLLDIASAEFDDESGKVKIETISSGYYWLPECFNGKTENLGIRIRYYFGKYPGSHRAYVKNWRCVGFETVGIIKDILREDLNNG